MTYGKWYFIIYIIVVSVMFPMVYDNSNVVVMATSDNKQIYALYLIPRYSEGVPGYWEKFIVGLPWIFRSYRSDAVNKPTTDEVLNASVIFGFGKPGSYILDSNVYTALKWAVGNGTTLICNNYFAVAIANMLNISYELVYEPAGNKTVYLYDNTTTWISLWSSGDGALVKIMGVPGTSTMYAWINFTTYIHPLMFSMRYGNGKILVYPQYGVKSMRLEELIVEKLREYAWSSTMIASYGWIDGKDMVMFRLDDLFPYMDAGAEKFSILEYYVNNICKKYGITTVLGATPLGREFEAVTLIDGVPDGAVFSANTTLVKHGTITKLNISFIVYDNDGDGKIDTIRYDLDHDNNYDEETPHLLVDTDPIVVTYDGYTYNFTTYTTNSLTAPTIIKFGLYNNITYQYNSTYISTVNEWIKNGYIQLVRHGWNHWSAGFNYAVEFYKPFSNDVYSVDKIKNFFLKGLEVLTQTFNNTGIIISAEIRPFGGYTKYPGDDVNFREALRELGIVSLSTSSLNIFDELSDVKLDGSIYVDALGSDTSEIYKKMNWLYLRGEPINVFSHPTDTVAMNDFKYYIWYIGNNTDRFIIVSPSTFIDTYLARLRILNTSAWNMSITDTSITITVPEYYPGMTLAVETNSSRITGGTILGQITVNGTTYTLIRIESNTITITTTLNVDINYNYTIDFIASDQVSKADTSRFNYTINPTSSIGVEQVSSGANSYAIDYCNMLSIYVNGYLVYEYDGCHEPYTPIPETDTGLYNSTRVNVGLSDRDIAMWITLAIIFFILVGSYLLGSTGGLIIGLGFISILALHGAFPMWIAGATIIIDLILIYMTIRRSGGGS